MIKKIPLWIVAMIIIFGLLHLLDGGLVKDTGKIKDNIQLSSTKPIVEEENGQSKEIGNITFKYNKNRKSLSAIDEALNSLKQNEKLFNNFFGKKISKPVSIVLVNDFSKLQDLFGFTKDSVIDGYYVYEKQSIYIAVPNNEKEMNEFKQIIAHEYTHHLITSTIENKGLNVSDLPVWFHEGLAAYVERKDFGITSQDIEETKNVSFKELETHKQWSEHLRTHYNPYLQSRVLIGLLIKNQGVSVIHKLIEGCKEKNFDIAFEQAAGKTVSWYESETLKTLKVFPSNVKSARGELYQDKNPETALKTALELNDIIPNVREVIFLIAKNYSEIGDHDNSIVYYNRLVKLFPNSSYYQQLANALLFKDLDKAIEASKLSVKLADKEEANFYQKHLDKMNNLKEIIENGNPLKGYINYISNDSLLSDKDKVDLITIILDRYPNVSDGREELVSLKQSIQ
jgi:tetratricopeptide (TPR) repeat protein